jgi:hypothetical protein
MPEIQVGKTYKSPKGARYEVAKIDGDRVLVDVRRMSAWYSMAGFLRVIGRAATPRPRRGRRSTVASGGN